MKPHFYLASFLLLATACSNEDLFDANSNNRIGDTQSSFVDSNYRSEEEILEAAKNAVKLLDAPEGRGRSSINRTIADSSKPIPVIVDGKSRSGSDEPVMYAVNYENNEGFALIAANKNAPEIVAVTESGSYSTELRNEIPGLGVYLDYATDNLSSFSIGGYTPDPNTPLKPIPQPEYKMERDTVWFANVPQRVSVAWGQQYPEGLECPNRVSGCSNTAAAMAMTYFKSPTTLTLTYKGNTSITVDWEKIGTHRYGNDTFTECWCSNDTHNAIAQICRELGYRSGSVYNSEYSPVDGKIYNSTGTTTQGTAQAMLTFGYNVAIVTPTFRSIAEDLNNANSILLMSGGDIGQGRHMWVCDGAKAYNVETRYYIWNRKSIMEVIPKWELDREIVDKYTYHHFNWGFNGRGNGYYAQYDFKVNIDEVNLNFDQYVHYIKVTKN